MLITVNAFNNKTFVPDKYKNRTMPLEIDRGFLDEDEYDITIPSTYIIEAFPRNASLTSTFGNYEISFVKNENGSITYKRKLLLKKGHYPKEEYHNYREFIKEISKLDNSKIVLLKK
jgi:Domain of Unknown Function with PDB structure (DUF3858)